MTPVYYWSGVWANACPCLKLNHSRNTPGEDAGGGREKKEVKEKEKEIASDNRATGGGGERGRSERASEREREAVARRDRGQKRD